METHGEDMTTVAEFSMAGFEHVPFVLSWYPSHEAPPRPVDAHFALDDTQQWWQEWSDQCVFEGEYREAVLRSLITLKALTYQPTGGIVAAATTSLPETLGGGRNWDYRYCWLRDATLTLESLMRGGFHDEALAWRDWLLRAVAGDVSELQIMYGPAGERQLDERDLDWLPGYEGSKPVRVGNAAAGSSSSTSTARSSPRCTTPVWRAALRAHRPGTCRLRWWISWRPLAGARRRHLGGTRPPPALHPLQGHGVGGRRPGRARVEEFGSTGRSRTGAPP